jgi:hypothetical protein
MRHYYSILLVFKCFLSTSDLVDIFAFTTTQSNVYFTSEIALSIFITFFTHFPNFFGCKYNIIFYEKNKNEPRVEFFGFWR